MGAQRGSEACSRPHSREQQSWEPTVVLTPSRAPGGRASEYARLPDGPCTKGPGWRCQLQAQRPPADAHVGRHRSLPPDVPAVWLAGPTTLNRCPRGRMTPPSVRLHAVSLGDKTRDKCTGALTTTHRISSSSKNNSRVSGGIGRGIVSFLPSQTQSCGRGSLRFSCPASVLRCVPVISKAVRGTATVENYWCRLLTRPLHAWVRSPQKRHPLTDTRRVFRAALVVQATGCGLHTRPSAGWRAGWCVLTSGHRATEHPE